MAEHSYEDINISLNETHESETSTIGLTDSRKKASKK